MAWDARSLPVPRARRAQRRRLWRRSCWMATGPAPGPRRRRPCTKPGSRPRPSGACGAPRPGTPPGSRPPRGGSPAPSPAAPRARPTTGSRAWARAVGSPRKVALGARACGVPLAWCTGTRSPTRGTPTTTSHLRYVPKGSAVWQSRAPSSLPPEPSVTELGPQHPALLPLAGLPAPTQPCQPPWTGAHVGGAWPTGGAAGREPLCPSPQGDTVYATVTPELEEAELEKNVHPMVLEYFEHGDTLEVMELLRELNLGSRKQAVPSLAVALALEGKASHRELTSRLLSDLVGKVMTSEDIARAFDKMLKDLPDLILDTPEAPQMLGQFIARAVADHALPLDFLDRYKGRVDCEHARAALDRAAVLLRIKRDVNQLDNVWGVGGGQRPVKHLIKEMNLLLREYLLSGEVSEAEHCLRELEVPHFHHELVYEAVVMVLESTGETPVVMMVKLLKVLWETGLVTLDQMNRGFQRVYDELGDISLDVPLAHRILERLVDLCFEEGVITKQLRDTCPARGRKRFVSEGDGGQIKQ
ncbi:hypothetical protein KIL84_001394 [Mauremys mutica]|uniref:Programmed cell death protein 4 n=1 Tax=Mauremys mutica TaxID=74926 RepID=A0A9D3WUG7_9SAUR|nr:hypothetical protein KIL84_001394 [Mauremys mutica]